MSEQDNEIFDFQVKSIMSQASEEVPGRVWDSLETKLDIMAEARRKTIFFKWLRYSTITLATAAAVTLWLIFPKDRTVHNDDIFKKIEVAETQTIQNFQSHAELPKPEKLLALTTRAQVSSTYDKSESNPAAEKIEAAKHISQINASETEDNSKTDTGQRQVESLSPRKSPYAKAKEMPDFQPNETFSVTGEKKRISTSVVIYGDAVGNAAIKKSTNRAIHMMAPPRPIENKLEEVSESSYMIPITFGVGARISFTPRWSITAGVNYTMLSRSFKGFWYIRDNDGLVVPESRPIDITNTQSYIGIPINVYFNIVKAKFLDFYVYAGGTMEKCVENRFKFNDFPGKPRTYSTRGLQWSANIGIGVEFILTDWLGLYLDPNVRYYFNTNQPKSIRTVQPMSFGCELGLRVRL